MYATADQVGQFIECPDCFAPNAVKESTGTRRSAAPLADGQFSYDMGPVQESGSVHAHAQELLERASREVREEIERQPVLPRRPLIGGVFSFPFRLQVLPVTIGLALVFTVVLGVVKIARELMESGALFAPVVCMVAAVVVAVVLVASLVCWFKILENTIQGEDDADYRPEGGLFAFIDWIGETFYVIIAISVSSMPIFLIADVLGIHSQAALTWYLLPVLAAAVPFPVVLLSMLEANSPLMPYSRPIWSSLISMPTTWLAFYSLSLVLVGCAAGASLAAWHLTSHDWTAVVILAEILLVFCVVAALTAYFRLLGRLGWVLTQQVVIYEQLDEEDSAAGNAVNHETSVL
jgi:hypothetical protein